MVTSNPLFKAERQTAAKEAQNGKIFTGSQGEGHRKTKDWFQGEPHVSMNGSQKQTRPPSTSCLRLPKIKRGKSRFLCHYVQSMGLAQVTCSHGMYPILKLSDRKVYHSPESHQPRDDLPSGARSTFLRVLRFSCYSILVVNLLASYS